MRGGSHNRGRFAACVFVFIGVLGRNDVSSSVVQEESVEKKIQRFREAKHSYSLGEDWQMKTKLAPVSFSSW